MKTLRQMLVPCTEEQLQQIAQLWGIGDKPGGGWIAQRQLLVQRMQDMIAARFVWEHLTQDERQVLYNLLKLASPNGVIQQVLLKITQLPEQSAEAAISSLKQHLLLVEEQGKAEGDRLLPLHQQHYKSSVGKKKTAVQEVAVLAIPTEIAEPLHITGRELFTSLYDRSAMTLTKILNLMSQNEINEIGQSYGIRLNEYFGRSDPHALLLSNLVQPQVPLYALEQFDTATRKLCVWLNEQGGKASMQAVREYTGYDDAALSSMLHTLARYAIAFDTFSNQERKLFMPNELQKNLKKAIAQIETLPEAAPTGLVPLDSPPHTIRSGDTLLAYDIAVLIGAVYQQDIEPTKSGTVPKRIVTKIQPLLHVQPRIERVGQEDFTVDMLFSVMQRLGLVRLSQNITQDIKEHFEPGPQLVQWSRLSVLEQNRRLLEHWLTSQYWADIPGVNYVSSYSYYLDYITPRNAIMGYLSKCTPGRWYTVASLLNTIKAQDPYLIRSRQPAIGLANYRISKEVLTNWDKCDGEYITGILSSTLSELGVVSLGYQQHSDPALKKPVNPDAFMLTDVGATILALQKPVPTQDNRSLVLQPNFELLLLHPDLPTLYSLLPFTQVNQVGVVSRLTLTRNSVLRGMASGKSAEQILQLLEQRSQKEIPQNVAYTLRDWTKLYKEATISHIVLIEVANESLANEICAAPKLQEFELRRLGPCAVAVSSEVNLQSLRRALDKEGYVVRISSDAATGLNNKYPITYGRPR